MLNGTDAEGDKFNYTLGSVTSKITQLQLNLSLSSNGKLTIYDVSSTATGDMKVSNTLQSVIWTHRIYSFAVPGRSGPNRSTEHFLNSARGSLTTTHK